MPPRDIGAFEAVKHALDDAPYPEVPNKKHQAEPIVHQEFYNQGVLPVSAEVHKVNFQEIPTTESDWARSTTWTFRIEKRDNQWFDISKARLFLTLKIQNCAPGQQPANIATNDCKAMVEKFWPHLMFSKVDLKINTHQLPETAHYQYRTFLPRIINMKEDDIEHAQWYEGFYPTNSHRLIFDEHSRANIGPYPGDNDTSIEALVHGQDAANANIPIPGLDAKMAQETFEERTPGLSYAMNCIIGSHSYSFLLPISIDLCEQPKMIPPNVDLEFQFHRNMNPWMCIRTEANHADSNNWNIVVEDVKMHVNWAELVPEVHQKRMQEIHANNNTAKMSIMKRHVNIVSLHNGTNMRETIQHNGKVPRRVILGFIENERTLGTKTTSIFDFEPLQLQSFWLDIGGTTYPDQKFQYYFQANQTAEQRFRIKRNMKPYENFKMDAIPIDHQKPYLSYKRWESECPILCVDTTADRNAANALHYKPAPKMSAIHAYIRTYAAIQNRNMCMVVMTEDDGVIEIPIDYTPPIVDV